MEQNKLTEAMKAIMIQSYTSGATPAEGGAAIGAFAKMAIVAGVSTEMVVAAWQEAEAWLRNGGLSGIVIKKSA